MEANKDLLLRLIRADLKHNQLVSGLRSIHFESDVYCLSIVDTVAKLMGIEGDMSDQWFKIYTSYIDQAHKHEVQDRGENLIPVAEECYSDLVACLKIERLIEESEEGQEQGARQN